MNIRYQAAASNLKYIYIEFLRYYEIAKNSDFWTFIRRENL